MHTTVNRPTARLVGGGLLALGLLAALWYQRHGEKAAVPVSAGEGSVNAPALTPGPAGSASKSLPGGITVQSGAPPAGSPGGPGFDPASDPAIRRERLRLAEERLATYRSWAKYPPASRPARENADQLHPTAPVERKIPLSLSGQPSQNIALKLRQDRLAVVGNETLTLGIRCEDSQGQVQPCTVLSAVASALPTDAAPPTGQRPVQFTADPQHEGELIASFRPLDLQLVERTWPLRVDVKLRAGSDPVEQGAALFDFLFTPEPPAVATGKIREALVDGSLVLYYGLNVRKAGRYMLHVRVDDAAGKELAFLEWNDPLPAGAQEVKFILFGKLVLDEHPRMPLKARDLDGFLLKEDADPDRELIPALSGYHHTTQAYPSSAFSAREWQSEERTRHESKYEHDVEEARQ